jgi:predicted O-methyltransferase YrrM
MNALRRVVKSVIPAGVRQYSRECYRDFVFRRGMRRFQHDPAACTDSNHPALADLIYGWANEGWSAMSEYLVASIAHALKTPGPSLECGSGLSTILMGAIAKKRGYRHWALEHHPAWADRVRSFLVRYGIDSVELSVKPLRDYGEYAWYDPPLASMPDRFALILCDGPPGDTKEGRYGLAPVLRERMKPGCVILLDDAERPEEQAAARRWEAELGSPFKMVGHEKPYIEMTLGGR